MNDRDIAQPVQDLQARARDQRFMELPGYMAWSERQLLAGGNEALKMRPPWARPTTKLGWPSCVKNWNWTTRTE